MGRQWKFKACPKCKGDMFIEKDMFGWYEQCLQCGYLHDLDNEGNKEKITTARMGQGRPAGCG
ncbi:MAG: hypothetical protein NTV30_07190 [Chloroflexi bacterium]|nr:hypothetical protein [Chloroflexota bacterium]